MKATNVCREVSRTKASSDLFGTNWGYGFFKYKACDYCDDIVGETADISIGDAWLPEYVHDSAGTSVLVVRNKQIGCLLHEAAEQDKISLEHLDPQRVVESQAGGYRHRREGLAYRLAMCDKQKIWRPQKRVLPSVTHLTKKRQKIYALRSQMVKSSSEAFRVALQQNRFNHFVESMTPLINEYDKLYKPPVWKRVYLFTRCVLSKVAQKIINHRWIKR